LWVINNFKQISCIIVWKSTCHILEQTEQGIQTLYRLKLSLLISLFILLAGCSSRFIPQPLKTPPPSARNPPIYSGAINVTETLIPVNEPEPARQITFESNDEPDKVLAYYRNVLEKDGWEIRTHETS